MVAVVTPQSPNIISASLTASVDHQASSQSVIQASQALWCICPEDILLAKPLNHANSQRVE